MDRFCNNMYGLTLVEIMITLSITAILFSLAAPCFSNLIKHNRLTTQFNKLLSALSLTRDEAVKQGMDIIILSNDGIVDNGDVSCTT